MTLPSLLYLVFNSTILWGRKASGPGCSPVDVGFSPILIWPKSKSILPTTGREGEEINPSSLLEVMLTCLSQVTGLAAASSVNPLNAFLTISGTSSRYFIFLSVNIDDLILLFISY